MDRWKILDRWDVVGMDLLGPFPVTQSENKFVCVVTCLFSKFVYARAVPDKSAQSVGQVIIEMSHLYGPPKRLVTDQEEDYRSQVSFIRQ